MKRPGGARHEHGNQFQAESFAGHAAVRVGDLRGLRLPRPPAAGRPREVHRVVAVSVPADRRGNRLGYVPLLALKEHPPPKTHWHERDLGRNAHQGTVRGSWIRELGCSSVRLRDHRICRPVPSIYRGLSEETCAREHPDYFCRRNLWRISGQNSLAMLLMLAASSCATQFTAVLCKLRSSGG